MKIETKFSIGDSIFFVQNNGIELSLVERIDAVVENASQSPRIRYSFLDEVGALALYVYEDEAFSTIDELFESLKSNIQDNRQSPS